MSYVTSLSFAEARSIVLDRIHRTRSTPAVEQVPIAESLGRILAIAAQADRDYPPLSRSTRDGYAVRSEDIPGVLNVIGELRAGQSSDFCVERGQAVEIMTGAPVPDGADTVVMVEHVQRENGRVSTDRSQPPGTAVNRQGSEARAGSTVVAAGTRLGFAQIAMLATIGMSEVPVFRKPAAAILPTGDEIVPIGSTPQPHQVRDSNSYSLAAQVRRAGGEPVVLPVAGDNLADTRRCIEQGLGCDLLLLSGGVSAGKYDLVERVLADFGAEFYFTRVRIQPGQPLVFGHVQGKYFFGLPGNPASTMVTFELFARAAIELLGGASEARLALLAARLTEPFRHKTGLTRFLPARLAPTGMEVTPVAWQGSSDVASLARSNAFLVADAEREHWAAGDWIPVLPQ